MAAAGDAPAKARWTSGVQPLGQAVFIPWAVLEVRAASFPMHNWLAFQASAVA